MSYVHPQFHSRVSEWKLREQICDIGRRLWWRGFCAGSVGSCSCRMGPKRFLLTPAGVSVGFLKPADLCLVDPEGMHGAGRREPSAAYPARLSVYKDRPDANAVVIAQPPYAAALVAAGIGLPESLRSDEIIMDRNGIACFGADLEQCYLALEHIEAGARIAVLARQLDPAGPGPNSLREAFVQPASAVQRVERAGGRMDVASTSEKSPDLELEQMVQVITDQIMFSRD